MMEEVIQKAQVNNSTISVSKAAREILFFAKHLCFEDIPALEIAQKVISIFLFKNQKRLKAEFKLRNIEPKQYLFKRNEKYFFFKKVIFFYKRDYLKKFDARMNFEGFEKLNFMERCLLTLVYKLSLKPDEVCNVMEIDKSTFFELLYNAKFKLGFKFDRVESSVESLNFSSNDSAYFYQKNLEVYENLNTLGKNQDTSLILKKIPNYIISADDHFKTTYEFVNGFKKIT